jgi:hypothetical protein
VKEGKVYSIQHLLHQHTKARPTLQKCRQLQVHVAGKATLEADIKKNNKYREACAKAGHGFQAVALDTSGVLSPDSYSFLCRLATSYAAIINRPYAYAFSLRLRRVSFAI